MPFGTKRWRRTVYRQSWTARRGSRSPRSQQRRQRRCRDVAGAENDRLRESSPKSGPVPLRHRRRTSLRRGVAPILIPHVVERAHRVITSRVVGFEIFQRAEANGAHPSTQTPTLRSHDGKHLQCVETFRQLRCHERVEARLAKISPNQKVGSLRSRVLRTRDRAHGSSRDRRMACRSKPPVPSV